MEIKEIMQSILGLVNGAKFSVWENEPPFVAEDDPSATRFVRFGRTICWNNSNISPCPSEEEITAYINAGGENAA